jgi:hypothetical protein
MWAGPVEGAAELPPPEIVCGQWTWRSGPAWSGKLRVLSACTPALCSPLNGVIAPGQPAAAASFGELNHRPRWYICTGLKAGFWAASGKGGLLNTWGAGATFGATAKVSMLKRPMNVPLA